MAEPLRTASSTTKNPRTASLPFSVEDFFRHRRSPLPIAAGAMESISEWGLSPLSAVDPEIHDLIEHEKRRQSHGIELIVSENFTSFAVIEALGSALTNKYSGSGASALDASGSGACALDTFGGRGHLRPRRSHWPAPSAPSTP